MARGDKRKVSEDAEDQGDAKKRQPSEEEYLNDPVSYTHLTLPTKA